MIFVCPRCKGELTAGLYCDPCRQSFPVVAGIPDFRLFADPYIGIDEDRQKAETLAAATEGMSFRDAVAHYYSITPDDPPDLAVIWTERAMAEVEIAAATTPCELDIGCSTGAALIAAGGGTGVDIALRWLVLGALRLREAGCSGTLVCANAEHLPFPADAFASVRCADALEHLRDAPAALREMRRVAQRLLLYTNNRYAPLPEPHVHLWCVGFLPRRWQSKFVAWRRPDLHVYRIVLRGAIELRAMLRNAGWNTVRINAAPLIAPHRPRLGPALRIYNRLARLPLISVCLQAVAPRLMAVAGKERRPDRQPSTAATAT